MSDFLTKLVLLLLAVVVLVIIAAAILGKLDKVLSLLFI